MYPSTCLPGSWLVVLPQESLARDEIVRLQTTLRDKEERLATTVISYLVRQK